MRIAQLASPRQFALSEGAITNPGPGEVQVEVKAVGICGSDIHYFSEGGIGDIKAAYPMVLGHEPTGRIRAVGDGVSGWAVGDHAALEPALYCYHCEFCLSGRHNLCANCRFLSSPTEPGFFRDFVNLPAHNLLPLPGNLSFAEGTLHEPLSVILHSMEFVKLKPGETAAVYGAGPIGLLTIAVLRMSGASRIFAIEPLAHRQEMARHMGADDVLPPGDDGAVKQILHDTGGRGVDVAIDCVTKGDSINQSLSITRGGGRTIVTGVPSELRISLDFHMLRRKEISFYSVRRSNRESHTALEMLSRQPKFFAPLVTHRRPVDDIQGAFTLVESYSDGVGKAVVEF